MLAFVGTILVVGLTATCVLCVVTLVIHVVYVFAYNKLLSSVVPQSVLARFPWLLLVVQAVACADATCPESLRDKHRPGVCP